jgi:hypothetical protein
MAVHLGLQSILEVTRGALNQEFQITDRLETRARHLTTLGGAWFAVSQVVAATSLDPAGASHGWALAVGATGLVAAVSLAWLFAAARRVWRVQRVPATSANAVQAMIVDGERDEESLLRNLINQDVYLLGERRRENAQRGNALQLAESLFGLLSLAALAEIVVAVTARMLA